MNIDLYVNISHSPQCPHALPLICRFESNQAAMHTGPICYFTDDKIFLVDVVARASIVQFFLCMILMRHCLSVSLCVSDTTAQRSNANSQPQ